MSIDQLKTEPAHAPLDRRLGLPRSSEVSLLAFLMLASALPYANVLLNDFIYTYDDGTQILKNPYVHSLRHLREIFLTNVWSYLARNTVTNYYRPVMTLGYLFCYKVFGPLAYGFHLTSVVLHSAVVCLVFLVTGRMSRDHSLAFVAALLFALHPVHVEAVAWISAVTELEVTFFFLASFWFFLRVARGGGGCSELEKLGMAGCYILALLSKEQALTLPLLAAVYEHFYRDDRRETTRVQKLSRYGVLWLCGIAYVLFRIHFLGGFAPSLQRPRLGWSKALLGASALTSQYLWKLLWPAHLLAYYGFPDDIRVLVPWMVGGFGALILCAVLFITLWKRRRIASFGLVWLLLTLAPVLNARWMASNVFNERYLYLPSVGFCWLVAWAWKDVWHIARDSDTVWRAALLASAGVVLALCALRIITRNRDWHDDVALYTRTLEDVPNSERVMSALGLAYWEQGKSDAAERQWRRLLALNPDSTATWNYLGVVLAERKSYTEAVRCFEWSLELDPSSADKHLNLGAAYAEQGLMELAEVQFRAAVALAPLNTQAHNVLGKLYFDAGRLREAEEQFRQSIAIEPNVAAYDHLGYIYLNWGNRDLAERAFKGTLSLDSSEGHAHFNLGAIYAARGRYDEAVREYLAALRADPQDAAAQEALRTLKRQLLTARPSRP